MKSGSISALIAALCMTLIASPAWAYIGPGAGLGAIAVTIALVVGVFLLVVGLVWYPLKRLLRKNKSTPAEDIVEDSAE